MLPKYVCKERRCVSDAEIKKLLACDLKPQDRLYIDVLRRTGMRPSEALALQWNDIDFDNLFITVRRSFEFEGNAPMIKTTKTGRMREIPINAELASELSKTPKTSLFIFTYEDDKPFTKTVYRRMLQRIQRIANAAWGGNDKINVLNGFNFYSFRHTYATHLYYNAVKPGIISTKKAAQIMGHSEEMFLKRYTHIEDDKERLEMLRKIV